VTVPERDAVLRHLTEEYDGVFTPQAIEHHIDEYVAVEPASALVDSVLARTGPARRLLDIGCGYGAFVLAAWRRGVDAVGVERAPFEVHYARRRLSAERPGDAAPAVYVEGDALALPFADDAFDVVTLWNVLEHVDDADAALREAARVLAPGGWIFAVAPNYAAFRREAHYHVPWLPLMPRGLAVAYLRALGRRPDFLVEHVRYSTNRSVRRSMRRLGLRLEDQRVDKLRAPQTINQPHIRRGVTLLRRLHLTPLLEAAVRAGAANPFRPVIQAEARKP
jgi:SAM-dependent methyltransferase